MSFLARSDLITQTLTEHFSEDFVSSATILLNSLGPELKEDNLAGYDAFYIMPLSNYVVNKVMNNLELSMKLLYEMTKRFTSEGPMRPFNRKYPGDTLQYLKKWTKDRNPHVRRLVSECTRPRLPLSSPLKEFQKNPLPVIELLELIKDSPELYVRRSIANNLNDISKDNPVIVTNTLKRWSKNSNPNIEWMIKHSLRTLLKRGDPDALALIGYHQNISVEVNNFTLHMTKVPLGSFLEFSFKLVSTLKKTQNLMIDYIVYFMKSNGKQKPKVFKLSTKVLNPMASVTIKKKQNFKNYSTRKQYKGRHLISLQINGKEMQKTEFEVI